MRIEPLDARKTRLKLLLGSYLDAVESVGDAARGDKPGSRLLGRNLELWPAGSYRALERCLDELRRTFPGVYRQVWAAYVVKEPDVLGDARAPFGLALLLGAMPKTIYVPQAISENAGYTPSEAKQYARRRAA